MAWDVIYAERESVNFPAAPNTRSGGMLVASERTWTVNTAMTFHVQQSR